MDHANTMTSRQSSGQMNQDAAIFDQQLDQRSGAQTRESVSSQGHGSNQAAQTGASQGAADNGQGNALTSQNRQAPGASSNAVGRAAGQSADSVVSPPVDIFEDASGFTVMADMPGVSREDLTVRVTGDNLVIEGVATTQATSDVELLYGEASNPYYRRSFTLSRELDPGNIQASMTNGVLKLTIPKAEAAKPRRIEVSVG